MITAKRLKELLDQVPDNAKIHAYEGEDSGISISTNEKYWWIRAGEQNDEDTYTKGFAESDHSDLVRWQDVVRFLPPDY